MKWIRGKKALITGAASGIGRSIALSLAREGADVWLLDIDAQGLRESVEACSNAGVEAVGEVCDLAESSQISDAVRSILRRWGKLDILVNNAGVCYYGPCENMSAQQWDWLMGVNLRAPIQLTRELLPTLLAQPEAHILNVCSIAGLMAAKRMAAYHASKFALVGFSEALRVEYARTNMGVTALCPGFVTTKMFDSTVNGHACKPVPRPPAWMCTTPDYVAGVAIKAIRRNRGFVLITMTARVLWAVRRMMPRVFDFIRLEGWRGRKCQEKRQANASPVALNSGVAHDVARRRHTTVRDA